MIVSDARREANRRNARLSTGPKTPEGKERSRANALKHGLCASAVVPEDIEAIQSRADAYFHTLKPQNELHGWLVDQVALFSLRIDRCERIERRVRDKVALRAELTWEDDRRLEAEVLGGQLGRRPGEVTEALRRTPQGCDWMIRRWALLAQAAEAKGAWTPEQARLASDLLGTPGEFREGPEPGAAPGASGRMAGPAEGPAALARREIADLEGRRERAAELDEAERALASSDLTHDADPELRRLRRYESTLHRRLRWCLAQLRYESPHRAPHPDLAPRWKATLEAEPRPGPTAEPAPMASEPRQCAPPDLPPDPGAGEAPAPVEEVGPIRPIASRAERREKRVEARREARRRKLERLRA